MESLSGAWRDAFRCGLCALAALALAVPAYASPLLGAPSEDLPAPLLGSAAPTDNGATNVLDAALSPTEIDVDEMLQILVDLPTGLLNADAVDGAHALRNAMTRESAVGIAKLVIALPVEGKFSEPVPDGAVNDRGAISREVGPPSLRWGGGGRADPWAPPDHVRDETSRDEPPRDNPLSRVLRPTIEFLRENRHWILAVAAALALVAAYIGARGKAG